MIEEENARKTASDGHIKNQEEYPNLYDEAFVAAYNKYKETFTSIWNNQHHIMNNEHYGPELKATSMVFTVGKTSLAAFAEVTGFASQLSSTLMYPLLRVTNATRGIGYLPIAKQLDPVINLMNIHMIKVPPSPSPTPLPHPFIGISFNVKDFLALVAMTVCIAAQDGVEKSIEKEVEREGLSEEGAEMIVETAGLISNVARIFIGKLGASVKIGEVIPRAVAGTPIRPIPHIPSGVGFHSLVESMIKKNMGHAWMGSMFVSADGSPLAGSLLHLQNICSDVGMTSIHDAGPPADPENGVKAKLYTPTGLLIPLPLTRYVLTNPIPSAINPLEIPKILFRMGFNKLKGKHTNRIKKNAEKGKPCSAISKALNKVNNKLFNHKYTQGLYDKIDKQLKTYVGHPVDVAGGDLFTDSIDFSFSGVIPLSFERVWYSDSDYIGPLGHGWHHSYDMALFVDTTQRRAQMRLGDGRLINFDRIPTPEFQQPRYHRSEQVWLCYHEEGFYYLKNKKEEQYHFKTLVSGAQQKTYLLSAICNNQGFAIRFKYTTKGILTKIIDSVCRIYEIESDQQGRIIKVWTDAPERGMPKVCISEYAYSDAGDLIVHYDEVRQPLQLYYEQHLLVKEVWRNGHRWFFKYEGKQTGARCIETWGDGGIQHFKLNYYQGETHVLDGEENKTIYKHRNQMVYETIDAKGAVWKKCHNKYGELERSTDPLGNVKNLIRDDWGNVIQIIEPDGQFTRLKYLNRNFPYLPTEVIDSRGGKWRYHYTGEGRLSEKFNPLGAKTCFTYNMDGLLSTITNGFGMSTVLEYDKRYNVASITGIANRRTQYHYDLWNRCTQTTNAYGAEQRRILDRLGRTLWVHDFDGNTIHLKYDALDNVIQYEDHHRCIYFNYKGVHKLVSRREDGKVIRLQYDSNERLRTITNEEGQQFEFELDVVGNIVQERGFDGLVKKYKRNEVGWITAIHRPNQRWTNYVHDEMGQVIQVNYSDETHESYTYEAGLLQQAVNSSGTLEMKYNLLGQLVEECFNGQKVQSTYDAYGRHLSVHSSLGANFEYEFDANGQVIASQYNDWKVMHAYDSFGMECLRTYAGGMQQIWEYDAIGRLRTQRVNKQEVSGVSIPQFYRDYVWDVGGLLSQFTEIGHKHRLFQRNTSGSLQKIHYGENDVEERGVDASGNLYSQLNCKDRRYNKNRLEETKVARYQYDKEGYLIEKEEKCTGKKWQYQWNGAGMLRQVLRPDGYAVEFQYDALGRRVSKRYKSTTTHYVWQGDVVLHEYKTWDARETTAEDIITWVFEENSFVPMAKIKGEKCYSLVSDHLGTPIRAYSASGDKVWERELDSCGNARMTVGEVGFCNYLYQGQHYDRETGLAYNRFRYYDPEIGNYISQDPIGLAGNNPTLYGYVADPTRWLDVFGLDLTDQMTFKEAFRRAKQQLRIPKVVNNPKPVYVFDKQYENRTVWAFTGDHSGKFIVMHAEDKFGRGPHLHTADDKKGSPLSPGKYNQHDGHIPENMKGISNIKKHNY